MGACHLNYLASIWKLNLEPALCSCVHRSMVGKASFVRCHYEFLSFVCNALCISEKTALWAEFQGSSFVCEGDQGIKGQRHHSCSFLLSLNALPSNILLAKSLLLMNKKWRDDAVIYVLSIFFQWRCLFFQDLSRNTTTAKLRTSFVAIKGNLKCIRPTVSFK